MTYFVFGGTLSLTQSINQPDSHYLFLKLMCSVQFVHWASALNYEL